MNFDYVVIFYHGVLLWKINLRKPQAARHQGVVAEVQMKGLKIGRNRNSRTLPLRMKGNAVDGEVLIAMRGFLFLHLRTLKEGTLRG